MKKVLLVILDGFGEGKDYPGNAITHAKTPTITGLKKNYPWTILKASGEAVGIPAGTQGGSEVGHFTIGAGRIVYQSLEEINRAIRDESFFKKPAFKKACERVKKNNSALHLLGMISDQGVHSDIRHLFALLEMAKRENVEKIYIHAITDGRDVPEKSADLFIKQIQKKIAELKSTAKLATICGRYFAMDRDNNWDRTEKAYDLYALGTGVKESDPFAAIKNAYKKGAESDYYIPPVVLDERGVIKNEDAVIFWNYRTDRARQLTWVFTGESNPKTGHAVGFKPKGIVHPFFVCMGPFSQSAPIVFHAPIVKNNLGEVISKAGLKQLRIAETEKYPHVTFFFNSQVEEPYKGEERVMIDSPKVSSYAQKPEMSAPEITKTLLKKLPDDYALIILNFANCDLVGHSGDLPATIKAVETVDVCLGQVVTAALAKGYTIFVTADHGNAEYKIYEGNHEECPSHSTNPVPFIYIGNEKIKLRKNGELKDIAPTVLQVLGVKKPAEMTGTDLSVIK
ncbi:MAG: 2,3-bisphosphoglycerate-independent phosphoglycerate mutase [Patescibacteria group bacterium]